MEKRDKNLKQSDLSEKKNTAGQTGAQGRKAGQGSWKQDIRQNEGLSGVDTGIDPEVDTDVVTH